MTQSPGQFEIQLGHLCNNRCVFCVSGQLTSRGEAPLLAAGDLLAALDDAWSKGHRRVTLLGGEPTIQPYFMDVLRHALGLGFEVVIFSNGSKPGRTALADEVAAAGGARVEWRFSFQGATREAHERTTRRRGSFAQLVRALERARGHGHRVTVNMCVVRQNYDSVDLFPELLVPRGVSQLHLDMVNPYDTGTLSEEGITAMMPRYSDLVPPLERMIERFPEGFDVNVGNLPYCVAPHLARFIHHGGERTWTVTANDHGEGELASGRRKYTLKQAFKSKPEACKQCVFDDRCSGVFDAYADRFGTGELRPVLPGQLAGLDTGGHFFSLRAAKLLRAALRRAALPAPFTRVRVTELGPREVELCCLARAGDGATAETPALVLSIVPPPEGAFATDVFAARVENTTLGPQELLATLHRLWDAILAAAARPLHPPGPDVAAALPHDVGQSLPRAVAARLARLRRSAPFGELSWVRADEVPGGVELTLQSPGGERVIAWVTEVAGQARSGYRVEPASPGGAVARTEALMAGVRCLLVGLGRLPEAALAADAAGPRPAVRAPPAT
jgi:MoaA/NifB/PqqE/SkfB family radical SAM enzyme